MKVKLEQNGWEKLTGRLAEMIEANPDSRAYRDYVLVPGRNSHA